MVWGCCNVNYLPKTHLEYYKNIAMLCAKLSKRLWNWVIRKKFYWRLPFKLIFGWIFYIATDPEDLHWDIWPELVCAALAAEAYVYIINNAMTYNRLRKKSAKMKKSSKEFHLNLSKGTNIAVPVWYSLWDEENWLSNVNLYKLEMSMARQRLKSSQSLYGTSNPQPPHPLWLPISHGHEWLTQIPFVPCQSAPLPHSSNKDISNFDLETTRSRSWVLSKGKTIQSAKYLFHLLSFCFTSIR